MMVALLRQTDLGLESQDRGSILACRAVRGWNLAELFNCPFGERLKDLRMIVQIPSPDKLDFRVIPCAQLRKAKDSIDKDSGKQEVRKHDHPSVAQPGDVLQARFDQGKRYPGITDFAPAEPHAFPEHSGNLGNIPVRVRIRRSATDDNKRRLGNRYGPVTAVRIFNRFPNPSACGQHHLGVNPKLPPVTDLESVLCCVGVKHRRNVVLCVHRGKQHARNRENALAPPFPQTIKAHANYGVRELQVSKLEIPPGRQMRRKAFRERGKLVDRLPATGPVSAEHHADIHGRAPRRLIGAREKRHSGTARADVPASRT